jgi:hypothetical protein
LIVRSFASSAVVTFGSGTSPVTHLELEALHGRILQATLTSEGQWRLEAAHPSVRALERATERDLTSGEIATVKAWLVATAQQLERATESRAA